MSSQIKTQQQAMDKSIYWSVFTKTSEERAACNYCSQELSYFGGMTEMVKHMRSRHPEIELNPMIDLHESNAIIITTQKSTKGDVIATIEPLTDVIKEELQIDWDNPIPLEISLNESQLTELQIQQPAPTTKRVLKKRSRCWSVFTKTEDNKVLCGYCGKKFSFSHGRISNMKRHLKMKHDGLYHGLKVEEMKKKKQSILPPLIPFQENLKPRFDKLSKRTPSFFHASIESDIPQDMLNLMAETQEKIGFVPNAYQALSHRPNEMRSFLNYYNILMEDRVGGHLTTADKEMICIAVSAFNKCKYFSVAHSALFRISTSNKILADQVATNWETAQLDERQRSILQFVMKVTKCEPIKDKDIEELRCYGLDSADAWDIGSIVSFCSLSNRMAFLTNMLPNEQFYSLGWTDQKILL
ncbi:uncharacterized protein LOC106061693 isoform X1 [Biomphalaria glabrata]|uniref:Uncharacterized protein LOC106061693 isoform X1 n=1 Tax=Biomphalaria glabrata TaxID=6526 RepID=A0A9W3B751_BIOGL|nr:uncharacterized protein LOC106061693 isoform X1 [Biomphalaria glabrata]XP_055895268.1 uncharacterized protein LOC106061693 isoform X1 [Biomphalaria glabrata]XP_055895269.1 uncharacterized protein LOC106061693 isoform X1 [Biomphalaria glabrata]XP_055895270.1 uncharacterized protein LOC106061693 isoform X1 [Biomphalaria glabrata]XP_055895271.1 uncharacterized protein LOC106061693 isoform X1 [Biomphalaria glabrata]